MKIKRITSLLMALTVSCGVIQTVNNYSPVSFTAAADEQSQPTVFLMKKREHLLSAAKLIRLMYRSTQKQQL